MAVLTVFLCVAACRSHQAPPAATPKPRLVVVYATCSLNKSYLSPYNPSVRYTPNLERFAHSGVVFDRYQTEAAQSGTAFASLFTGTQAMLHGVFTHPSKLPDHAFLMSEAFEQAGYQTWAWLRHPMASADLNYAQGIEPRRAAHQGPQSKADGLRADDPEFANVLRRIKRNPRFRAYLETNFTVTHGRYDIGHLDEFCDAHAEDCVTRGDREDFARWYQLYYDNFRAFWLAFDDTVKKLGLSPRDVTRLAQVVELAYKSNVWFLDNLFGALADRIQAEGLWPETLFVFTADHGETLYRDGTLLKWGHGLQLNQDELSVPLIVRAPSLASGRFGGVTRSIDVFPTVAGLAAVRIPDGETIGENLAKPLQGGQKPPRLIAFSHSSVASEGLKGWPIGQVFRPFDPTTSWVGARDRDFFYMLSSRNGIDFAPAAYDLAKDPGQTQNVYDPRDPAQRRMIEALESYKKILVDSYQHRSTDTLADAERRRRLKSLGYL